MPRTLSKSRFTLAVKCPTKVYYSVRREYANTKDNEGFLEALADGGFQVGALAKAMYTASDPAAVEVTARGEAEQLRDTAALLERDRVTVFEGTVQHDNLLVRVDILVKSGDTLDLIEVKSKSFDPGEGEGAFRGTRGGIRSGWLPYFQDVAFQTYVVRKAYPHLMVRPFVLLVDKSSICSIDGVGQAIRVTRDEERRPVVTVDPAFDVRAVQLPLLRRVAASTYVDEILGGLIQSQAGVLPFDEFVDWVSNSLKEDRRLEPQVGGQCKKCEFYCEPAERSVARRSGWAECMEMRFPGRGDGPRSQTVFALYNGRADKLLARGKLLLTDCDDDDMGDEESLTEIKGQHRHRLQLREARDAAPAPYLLDGVIRDELQRWKFPLHFIDFETARPTLPFTRNRRPNQQLLFQYSHHVLSADGRLVHRSQCLETRPGVVPNAPVLRALRDALSGDDGTVLHWYEHEHSVLADMCKQLERGGETDSAELIAFINGLLQQRADGTSRLVDMGRPLVSKTAFFPNTTGKSSIKKVLPAVLEQSEYLRARYSEPVYGTAAMPSQNFRGGFAWWQERDGRVVDPYHLLDPLLGDRELDGAGDRIEENGDPESGFIANGGAAMAAYSALQWPGLPAAERQRIEEQLKRYCELDTLAMVMVYEALREWVKP